MQRFVGYLCQGGATKKSEELSKEPATTAESRVTRRPTAGDLEEEQPKAAGSSLLYKLTNSLTSDALKRAGATGICECLVLPMATGMTMTLNAGADG